MSNRKKHNILQVVSKSDEVQRLKSSIHDNLGRLGGPPDHFDEDLKDIWRRLAQLAAQSIKLEAAYRLMFELFCDCYREYREIGEQLRDEGYSYQSSSAHIDKMARKNPLFDMRVSASRRLMNLADEFGLSPSSLAKLNLPHLDANDPAAEFFKD